MISIGVTLGVIMEGLESLARRLLHGGGSARARAPPGRAISKPGVAQVPSRRVERGPTTFLSTARDS